MIFFEAQGERNHNTYDSHLAAFFQCISNDSPLIVR